MFFNFAPIYMEKLGSNPQQIGVILGAFGASMAITHIPAGLLLVTVAFAPNFEVAAILFLLREGLVEMDVPTRQSYVMAMVGPDERVAASGVTNIVRMAGWAVGPAIGGLFPATASLLVGAGLKISYDVMLYRAFRSVRPREEI